MIDITERELRSKLTHELEAFAVFLYTPMCGTCKLAERMLSIIEVMKPNVALFKSNMNYLSKFAEEWQIKSIPCLLVMDKGELLYKEYAMKSLDNLYEKLSTVF